MTAATAPSITSIQGDRQSKPLAPGTLCKAGLRHGPFEGNTFQEKILGVTYWVAYLDCKECGTKRITKYEPRTGIRVGTHRYIHSEHYPKDRTQRECLVEWQESMLVTEL